MTKKVCTNCEKKLTRRNKSGYCQTCLNNRLCILCEQKIDYRNKNNICQTCLKIDEKFCVDCNKKLDKRAKSGYCLTCLGKHKTGHNHPNWKGASSPKFCTHCNNKLDSRNKSGYCAKCFSSVKLSGSNNPNWKGGKSVEKKGYIRIRKGFKYVYEHRFVMEKKLGRKLKPGEVVHHKDGNKHNNKPDNLELFSSNGEHLMIHHKE
jgi:hypothetical protein